MRMGGGRGEPDAVVCAMAVANIICLKEIGTDKEKHKGAAGREGAGVGRVFV